MRAELKHLDLDPDPATLSGDPAEFSLLACMIVGPPDGPGKESFDVTVCTPEWLAEECRKSGGIYDPRHHLVVNLYTFDTRALRDWLATHIRNVEADTWAEVGSRLARLGYWEFEDYRPESTCPLSGMVIGRCSRA
jgi:hypothetical protein